MPPIPLPDPELRDDVIRLREPVHADEEAIFEACQDPLIQRFTFVPVPYRRPMATAFVGGLPRAREQGDALTLAISPAGGDDLWGLVGLQRFAWEHRTGDVGYWVAPGSRGHGAAARAVRLVAPWAIRTLGLARIELTADVENVASRRVAERAGFTYEGTLRSVIELKGRRWTEAVFSLIAEDLEP